MRSETRNVINQNFLIGIGFVLGGITLSAMDFITPVVAAIFHVAGSLLVVFNSFRLMRLGEELEPHEPTTTADVQGEPSEVHPQLQPAHP